MYTIWYLSWFNRHLPRTPRMTLKFHRTVMRGTRGDPTVRMRSLVAVVDSILYIIFDVFYIIYYDIINYPLTITIHWPLTIMVGARIIERKLRSTKVRLFTVPFCSIILFSSEGMKKTYLNLLFFSSFYNSGLFYNCVFSLFSHIYQFRSTIIFSVL